MMGGLVAAMAMTSCNAVKDIPEADLSGEWNVVSIQGNPVKSVEGQDAPFMAFDVVNSRLFGSAGCNRIFGRLSTG